MEDLEIHVPHPIYISNKMGCCHLCVVKVPDDQAESWNEPDEIRDRQISDAMQWYEGKIGPDLDLGPDEIRDRPRRPRPDEIEEAEHD